MRTHDEQDAADFEAARELPLVAAHTPGPWEIIQLPSMQYRIDAKMGPLHVCPAIAHGLPDAHLIAASPMMLAALIDAHTSLEIQVMRRDPDWDRSAEPGSTIYNVRAAIKAARGK